MSLPVAATISLLLSVVPATLAAFISNFMRADTTKNDTCIVKLAGLDDSPAIVQTDVRSTLLVGVTGNVEMLNERVTINSYAGNRTVVTDSIRIRNICAFPMQIFLEAQADPSGSPITSGNWDALAENVYLSTKTIAASHTSTLNAAQAGLDFKNADEWDQYPLRVLPPLPGSATALLSNTTTGRVVLPADHEVQIGILADAGAGYDPHGVATLNFSVLAEQA